MKGQPSRLSPEAFLAITDISPEWSLATTKTDIHLYARYEEDGHIHHFVGPNAFGYSDRELLNFLSNLKRNVMRVKGSR